VHATRTEQAHFGPEREADLLHILSNKGSSAAAPAASPADLPPAAQQIPSLPPEGWPALDAKNPETDFQLQQGLLLVRAMAAGQQAVSR
jgi:carboxyl-terminal processing protease